MGEGPKLGVRVGESVSGGVGVQHGCWISGSAAPGSGALHITMCGA